MTDHRFERTDQDIQRNFVLLLQKLDFNSITVANLVEQALISRPTFYDHFDSLFDLAQQTVQNYLQPFRDFFAAALSMKNKHASIEEIYASLADKVMLDLVERRREYLAVRSLPLGSNSFDFQLKSALLEDLAPFFSGPDEQLQRIYLTNILISNLEFVLQEQRIPSPQEVIASLDSVKQIIAGKPVK